MIDAWVAEDAPQIDGDEDGDWDQPETRIYQAIFRPVLNAAVELIIGDASTTVSACVASSKDRVEPVDAFNVVGAGDLAMFADRHRLDIGDDLSAVEYSHRCRGRPTYQQVPLPKAQVHERQAAADATRQSVPMAAQTRVEVVEAERYRVVLRMPLDYVRRS